VIYAGDQMGLMAESLEVTDHPLRYELLPLAPARLIHHHSDLLLQGPRSPFLRGSVILIRAGLPRGNTGVLTWSR
jgi:hypothetical protein